MNSLRSLDRFVRFKMNTMKSKNITIDTIKKKHKALDNKKAFADNIAALVGLAGITVKQRWFQAQWIAPEEHFNLINKELDKTLALQIKELQKL